MEACNIAFAEMGFLRSYLKIKKIEILFLEVELTSWEQEDCTLIDGVYHSTQRKMFPSVDLGTTPSSTPKLLE